MHRDKACPETHLREENLLNKEKKNSGLQRRTTWAYLTTEKDNSGLTEYREGQL
jgi:hypothetical protein